MKILIIDDSIDFRAVVRLYLSKALPESQIDEYVVEKIGRPPDNYDWSKYDVLLLDYQLSETEDGLEWLKTYGRSPGFPATIILTAEGDEYVAVKAVKLGAADYINKKDISPRRLKEMVLDAADGSPIKGNSEKHSINDVTQIIKGLHKEKAPLPEGSENMGYKFVRIIGRGAMSHVYLAERKQDRLSLVIKILDLTKAGDETLIRRFIQEAELIAELNSPFVVKIYEYGLTDGYGFIAMEFFSRGDLKQRMELKLTPEVVFNYMTHVIYGLDAIHEIGVVHRDLKPANIMFRGDDSLALADFGISKKMQSGVDLTTSGQIVGTPHYMSPEQGEGSSVDLRSDIYSAGVMLYELLTSCKPYTAQTPAAVIYQHVHGAIPKLPRELDRYQDMIDKALAKKPDHRYQTAREFIHVLEQAERECP